VSLGTASATNVPAEAIARAPVFSGRLAGSRKENPRFLEEGLNEAALRRTLSRVRTERHRRFETKSVEELSVLRYDEAIRA
jgi:hypothetical protein